jgi:hypothetical protein
MMFRGGSNAEWGNTTMASSNFNGGRGCTTKTIGKRRMVCKSDTSKIATNKKKTCAKACQTIDSYILGLEKKWRIYHEKELKQKDNALRWFYDESEDFKFVCELAGLESTTVRRLFEESLLADSVKPMKRIYNY